MAQQLGNSRKFIERSGLNKIHPWESQADRVTGLAWPSMDLGSVKTQNARFETQCQKFLEKGSHILCGGKLWSSDAHVEVRICERMCV